MQRQVQIFQEENVLRFPRLDTILMIENAVREAGDAPTKTGLWKSLPRKVMYQTFRTALDYLAYSNKIAFDREGRVVWIWDPDGVRNWLAKKKHLEV